MKSGMKSKLTAITLAVGMLSFAGYASASDFNIPFVNASGLGNAYADWATGTDDASVAYTNPAALVKLQHQQLSIAPLGIIGSTKFTGTTTAPAPPFPLMQHGSASSRIGAAVPSMYYAVPINDRFTFGFSATAPFGLGTSYDKNSLVRYISTRTKVVVIDASPSIGFRISDKLSAGFGLDADRLTFTLDRMVRSPFGGPNFESQNHVTGWGYGWHGGALYQATPMTRVGISFNSMVEIHATGDSESYTSFGTFRTTNQRVYAGLPARTQLSIHQDINPRWAIMGTLFYTNWSTFEKVTLKHMMLPGGSTMAVSLPFEYHDSFDYSLGLNYKPTDKWTLKTGFQIMSTPSNSHDRGVSDPIGTATIFGLGAHYQQNAALGYDFSAAHSFFNQMPVNVVTPVAAATGHNNTQTTVVGAQITWNIT